MSTFAIANLISGRRQLSVRMAGAAGVTVLGVCFLGLVPFLGVEPTAGAGYADTPTYSVNRAFKGDRLPVIAQTNPALSHGVAKSQQQSQQQSQQRKEIPFGCDASFSPITAPRLAYVYGRCLS